MDKDVAGLVERLEKLVVLDEVGPDNPLARAASTIRAQAAEIERLREHIAKQQMDIVTLGFMAGRTETAEAKLREAVEVIERLKTELESEMGVARRLYSTASRATEAEAKLREAVEVMRTLVEQRDGHFSTTEAWDRARAFLADMEKPRDP
jgi:sugar phosphate isomerase/epimerase